MHRLRKHPAPESGLATPATPVPCAAPAAGVGLDARGVCVTAAALAAAWVCAGSVGLLAHGLRLALTLILLLLVLAAELPRAPRIPWLWLRGGLGWLGAAAVCGLGERSTQTLSVPLLLAALLARPASRRRGEIDTVFVATACFGLYRFLYLSSAPFWQFCDGLAAALGRAAGWLSGQPLFVGATFGGLDFLVLALAWVAAEARRRPRPGAFLAAGVGAAAAAHFLSLVFLSLAVPILPRFSFLPQSWRQIALWWLPASGAVLQAAFPLFCLRWTAVPDAAAADDRSSRGRVLAYAAAVFACALGLVACTSLCPPGPSLAGRRILLYREGFLNWFRPEHGQYGRFAIGMYGMLPHFLRSLGAEATVSADLTDASLRDQDALVLIFPDDPWTPEQEQAIWRFVERGGRLLLLGEHTIGKDADASNSAFNRLLAGRTAIRVRFDCATYAIGGWLQSYDALAHSATLGLPDDRNAFGVVIGASLDVRPPARPFLVGRWGWSDWGDGGHSSQMGNDLRDPGERLGDLVLAAEQRVGRGRVVVFGDTSSFSNGINLGAYDFTGRLFACLASDAGGPQRPWRGRLECLLAAVLALVLASRRAGRGLRAAALPLLVVAHALGTRASEREWRPVPAGRPGAPVALLDCSHLPLCSAEGWREDGTMGLAMTLMRDGYQVHTVTDFDPRRIASAALFVSVAPMRAYSREEIDVLVGFVRGGGTLIVTAGYGDHIPASGLLAAFGVALEPSPPPPRLPLTSPYGFFKSPFLEVGDTRHFVRFHAGWPLYPSSRDVQPLAYGSGNVPVLAMRKLGAGRVIVAGDTSFALNINLELENGQLFDNMRENHVWWRWMLGTLPGGKPWQPQQPGNPLDAPVADPPAAAGEGAGP